MSASMRRHGDTHEPGDARPQPSHRPWQTSLPCLVSGNVLVPLGAGFKRQGCTTAPKATVKAILKNPGRYYVNVHNAKHPAGAMRGQLTRGT